MVQPKNESSLGHVVKGDETDDEPSHAFQNGKGGKYDPVCQPLCVLAVALVNGFEGHVSGIDKANQINNQLGTPQQGQDGGKDKCNGGEKINFGVPSLSLEFL